MVNPSSSGTAAATASGVTCVAGAVGALAVAVAVAAACGDTEPAAGMMLPRIGGVGVTGSAGVAADSCVGPAVKTAVPCDSPDSTDRVCRRFFGGITGVKTGLRESQSPAASSHNVTNHDSGVGVGTGGCSAPVWRCSWMFI